MKKCRIILAKNEQVYFTFKYTHEYLISKYKIKGKDGFDWVRIVLDAEGNFQIKGKIEMPEWLERQYGYFKRKIKELIEL